MHHQTLLQETKLCCMKTQKPNTLQLQKKCTLPKVIPPPPTPWYVTMKSDHDAWEKSLNLTKLQIPERKNLKNVFHHFFLSKIQ